MRLTNRGKSLAKKSELAPHLAPYLQLFAPYLQLFAPYLQLFAPYLHLLCTLFAPYLHLFGIKVAIRTQNCTKWHPMQPQIATKSDPNGCLITLKLYDCLANKSELTPHFAPYLHLICNYLYAICNSLHLLALAS